MELVKNVVDYIIKMARENSSEGSWCVYSDELFEKFGIINDWYHDHEDEILTELYSREEILDVEQEWDGHKFVCYDVMIGTDYFS